MNNTLTLATKKDLLRKALRCITDIESLLNILPDDDVRQDMIDSTYKDYEQIMRHLTKEYVTNKT